MAKYIISIALAFMLFVSINVKGQIKNSIDNRKENAPGVKKILVDGKFWVWTQKIGDGKVNVLLLHGGPAQSHEYFEIFSKYLPAKGITIYYYDQFGSYYSQTPTPAQLNDTSIWKISRYVDEVEQVRKGLHLDKFFIYGHSYGALLALAYTNKYQSNVKGLIFSDMNPYPKDFDADLGKANNKTDSILSHTNQYRMLMQNKNNGSPYDTLLYNKLFEETFTRNWVVRLDTLPEELERTKKHKNFEVAKRIGPSTFSLDYASMIKNITVPVFLIRGQYDFIITTSQLKNLSNNFKKASYYVVPNAGHICFIDNPSAYFPPLIQFIKSNSIKVAGE
jgi:proline iminopeptidase